MGGQERQKFLADPVSRETHVAIAGVGAERLLTIAEIRGQFRAADAQQRPQERRRAEPPRARHAAQAADARAAKNAMQDRLGLIVGRVRGDDKACPHAPGHLFQHGISSPASGGLDPLAATAGSRIDRGRRNFARQPQLPAKLLDKGLIGVRIRTPQLVIHVRGDQSALAGQFQCGQSAEQGHAIASPGNRHEDGQIFPVLRRPRRRKAGFKGVSGFWSWFRQA